MKLDIDPKVKNDIRGFYVTKKFQGQTLNFKDTINLFKTRAVAWKFASWIHNPNSIKCYIKKCYLVEASHALDFFDTTNIYAISDRKLIGTDLYLADDSLPFWKDPEYGRSEPWFPKDIEENHIKKRLKNRHMVVSFLKMIKNEFTGSVQLNLFEAPW